MSNRFLAPALLATILAVGLTPAAPITPSTQPANATAPALRFNAPPPELAVTNLAGQPLALADLQGQPVVLQFGSITDPAFRLRQEAVEKLAVRHADKVKFILVYQKESHPADQGDPLEINATEGYAIAAPVTQAERVKLARMAVDRLKLKTQQVVVDEWNNTTARRYGGHTNMTFLLDAHGNLAAAYPWMDSSKLAGALDDLLAGREIAEAHRGPVRGTPPATQPDPAAPRPLGNVITILDALKLDEKQRAAILPPLTDYANALRALREKSDPKPTPEAQAALLEKAQNSARKLQSTLREQLPPNDYATLLESLTQGPGRRFFTENQPQ